MNQNDATRAHNDYGSDGDEDSARKLLKSVRRPKADLPALRRNQ